jgi:hypothetical protein
MNVRKSSVVLLMLASTVFGVVNSAEAQGLSRAQVRADLVRLEQAGYTVGGEDPQYPADIQMAERRVEREDAARHTFARADMPDAMSRAASN